MTIAERKLNAEILAAQELEEAAHFVDLEPWIAQRLHHPEIELQFNLQVRMDDGRAQIIRASRVLHSTLQGTCMGPLLFAKNEREADIRACAMKQAWKWALWEIAVGGSAGFVQADVGELSERELRETIRALVAASGRAIGRRCDVLTPSRRLPPQVMAWALTGRVANDPESFGCLTGKPLALQGVKRDEIAAFFLKELLRQIMRSLDEGLMLKQVILLGFDVHAQAIASQLERGGARIVGVADTSGAVCRPDGLNIAMLARHVRNEGVIYGYPEAELVKFDQMIGMPCDLLLLADGENLQLTPEAKVVVEVCGRLGEEAHASCLVIPEIIAGFGMDLADFLEWRRGFCGPRAELDFARVTRAMVKKTWRETFEYAGHHELSIGQAATALAVSRAAEGMRAL